MEQSDATINFLNWNERVRIHVSNVPEYDLEGFKRGKNILENHVLQELGDINGKTVLHLMCHFGMDTLSWARDCGAIITGVDFSDEAIKFAESLAQELNIKNTKFIISNVYDLPNHLHDQFDYVVMTHGVLCWLPDLQKLFQIVSQFMKEGGKFYLCDDHPLLNMFDEDSLTVKDGYFHKRIEVVNDTSYVTSTLKLKKYKKHRMDPLHVRHH